MIFYEVICVLSIPADMSAFAAARNDSFIIFGDSENSSFLLFLLYVSLHEGYTGDIFFGKILGMGVSKLYIVGHLRLTIPRDVLTSR